MKILVIGGLGYLGSRISEFLIQNNQEIKITSRKKINSTTIGKKRIQVINIKWNKTFLKKLVNQFDSIIFVAGYNSQDSVTKRNECIKFSSKNINIMTNVLRNNLIKSFIFISTAHVYKSNLIGNINEKSKVLNNHPYARSKQISEKILIRNLKNTNINLKIIRLSNAIGYPIFKRNNAWNLFLNDIIRQAVLKRQVIIKSNPNIQRNFISISEVCRFILFLIRNDKLFINIPILNFGSKKSHSLKQMITRVKKISIKNNLNFDIKYINKNETKKNTQLFFTSNFIGDMKFKVKNNLNKEIDMTIKKVKKWYKKK